MKKNLIKLLAVIVIAGQAQTTLSYDWGDYIKPLGIATAMLLTSGVNVYGFIKSKSVMESKNAAYLEATNHYKASMENIANGTIDLDKPGEDPSQYQKRFNYSGLFSTKYFLVKSALYQHEGEKKVARQFF
ncbi:MAG: hypothetical protein WC707_02960 [Candidatus Babeliaceae bacterium]|jgi:hypothetical protein